MDYMTFVLDMPVQWVSNHVIPGACAGDSGRRGGMIKSIVDRTLSYRLFPSLPTARVYHRMRRVSQLQVGDCADRGVRIKFRSKSPNAVEIVTQ